MRFGLPFMPLEDVNETFEYILENAEEYLDDLMNYILGSHGRAEEEQKLQDFCQKLGMFIYQY